ncbi:hypothetical protein [Actinopolyspora halophila]|uniref:hypothetical protein n=1 Tax=Actinopolyspora halophila TaxID=1850 RepID=UPI00036AE02B|nr:hypothetical protein [Actinopolyspora halophila]
MNHEDIDPGQWISYLPRDPEPGEGARRGRVLNTADALFWGRVQYRVRPHNRTDEEYVDSARVVGRVSNPNGDEQ